MASLLREWAMKYFSSLALQPGDCPVPTFDLSACCYIAPLQGTKEQVQGEMCAALRSGSTTVWWVRNARSS